VANLTRIKIDPTKLKAAREKAGLSQSEVATQVGVGKAAISKIELGEGLPSANILARLCKLYQLEIAEISSSRAA